MSVVVLLYSKYSTGCSQLLEKMSVLDFRKICVDHEEVRKLVVGDQKKYSIQKVPCILVFFSNGLMKKYEGADAFAWVEETTEKMKMISTPPPPPMVSAPPPSPVSLETTLPSRPVSQLEFPTPSQPLLQPFSTLPTRESIPVEPVEMEPEPEGVPDMRRHMDSAPLFQKSKAVVEPSTTDQQEKDNTPVRGIKSDKQENLMSLAQQMQKQREKEDETIQKV
jgi:hypothetical protein